MHATIPVVCGPCLQQAQSRQLNLVKLRRVLLVPIDAALCRLKERQKVEQRYLLRLTQVLS